MLFFSSIQQQHNNQNSYFEWIGSTCIFLRIKTKYVSVNKKIIQIPFLSQSPS